MTGLVAVSAACAAVVGLLPGSAPYARARLHALAGAGSAPAPSLPAQVRAPPSVWGQLAAALAGLAAWLLLGGAVGLLGGAVVTVVLARWLGRLEPAAVRADRERLTADLPVTLDLLGSCLAAGAPPRRAIEEVAAAVGGPLGSRLAVVAAHVRLGADPVTAWAVLGDVPASAPVLRAVARSFESGAAWGPTLERAARDLRARRRLDGEARARAVAVKVVLPLGACFLPAFILLGIVPTVWGIAAATFTAGL